ncbi:MAG: hypothetical protein A3C43_04145 [Candidatus Schekmanbacteria bacterium RIFCSPHIGHO2_02_FULL_38_11]|uniref:Response regulatory domain-containing protein n=1 Tax=Candidatus Schekmanbacteria bacterium RIFCSPLOWO2_12_FULL_38_15 TaxID=1817883 RepID=A0A1F7SFH8_9BACT|nr:MAG: hypothetical protein A2043_06855 [Candidatus Schekmanbacteria bacterium GWA2_38_9]OGL48563.1 MAG: hypothetical protein A3H37_05670 [Candidatus Schekmanbacteria bacterium RIFCSPLOWO2_02_FULL_38_14]OGL52543.1 MAG: hypothetical protein A3G31_11225 [Candidatus Schekmanbacteria bacterium RIFCSPLOWO2_12_FULL_38_15]OGL54369.1 MAG: hypothetical protein A3C43_04145 [Candidatus Schekmanbacteria bacterium RIFCSPHIGHO2_02_FULL_38_11]
MNEKILIIDNDEKSCETLKIRLEGEGYDVIISRSAVDGLRKVKDESPAIVILDYHIPDRNSIEVLNEIRQKFPNSFVIVTSGQGIEESAVELIKAGASDYFVKPLSLNKFVNIVKRLSEERESLIEKREKSKAKWRRFFEYIGVHFPVDKKDVMHFSPRIYYFLGTCLLVVIVFFITFIEFSTSSYFCRSCHIMRPYYNAWKTSKHNTVPCVDCHYPPGFREEVKGKFQAATQVVKWVTGTYSTKPYAEIEDASCLRKGCHSTRLLTGKVIFKQGIIFDHTVHLTKMRRGKKLRCTSCHSQIVQGTHIAVTENSCFVCHFKGINEDKNLLETQARCTLCHEVPKRDIKFQNITYNHKDFVGRGVPCQKCHLDAIRGNGDVPQEFCVVCHGEPEKLARYKDVEFMHLKHVTERNVECTRCHLEIKHSVRTSMEPLDYSCDICHKSKHLGEKQMYMGVGGKGIEPIPSPMFTAQVDCIGCHVTEALKEKAQGGVFDGFTLKPSEQGCISCHGKDYKGMLDEWKNAIKSSLTNLEPTLKRVESMAELIDKNNPKFAEVFNFLNDARYNYDFVKYAKGVHNVDYADALLRKSMENLNKAEGIFKGRKQ